MQKSSCPDPDASSGTPKYEAGHIPGRVFMELSELTDRTIPSKYAPAGENATGSSLGLGRRAAVVLTRTARSKPHARVVGCAATNLRAHESAPLRSDAHAQMKPEGTPAETGKEALRPPPFHGLETNDRALHQGGYGLANLPTSPGSSSLSMQTYRPTGLAAETTRPSAQNRRIRRYPCSTNIPHSEILSTLTWRHGKTGN